jgi:hypothetical protein
VESEEQLQRERDHQDAIASGLAVHVVF